MAYVDGETLGQRVRARGPMPPSELARVLREVAWGLAYAHAQGVVHRDVKADNILLERGSGRALVADFGIARVTQATGASGATGARRRRGPRHRGIHEPGAGQRRSRGRAQRHLLAGRRGVLRALGPSSIRGPDARRGAGQAHHAARAARRRGLRGRAQPPGAGRGPLPRQGPRGALRHGRGPRRRGGGRDRSPARAAGADPRVHQEVAGASSPGRGRAVLPAVLWFLPGYGARAGIARWRRAGPGSGHPPDHRAAGGRTAVAGPRPAQGGPWPGRADRCVEDGARARA